MREDVQIGDVFIYSPPQKSMSKETTYRTPPSLWLNRLGSLGYAQQSATFEALTEEYCSRYRMQPTPVTSTAASSKPGAATPGAASVPAAAGTAPVSPAATPPGTTIATVVTTQGISTKQTISVPAVAKSATPPKSKKQNEKPPTQPTFLSRCEHNPGTLAAAAEKDPTQAIGTTASPYSYDIGQSGSAADLRMHRVELPEITVANVTDAELAAVVPTSGLLARLGLGTSSNVGLDISLSGIEEVHLPFNREFTLFESIKEAFVANVLPPGILLAYLNQKRPDMLQYACNINDDNATKLNKSGLKVIVANQVVYAHGVDYAYKSASTVAGELGAALAAAAAASKFSKPSSTTGGTTVTTTVTNDATNDGSPSSTEAAKPAKATAPDDTTQNAAQSQLAAEAAKIAALTGSLSSPGGELQVGIGRSGNLTLSDKFPEPLAVGIGDLLEYAPSDLLWLYRKTVKNRAGESNAYLILKSLRDYEDLYCAPYREKGVRSLGDYIEGDGPELVVTPSRFQPSDGLETDLSSK